MSPSLRHFPELQAARQTLRLAALDAMPTSSSRRARVAIFLGLFAVGVAGCAALLWLGWIARPDREFWRTCIMVLAILSGFVITTMVFTGKIEASKSLSYSELRVVASKCTHLLLFQFFTLVNHLCAIVAVFLLPTFSAGGIFADAAAAVAIGLLLVSMWRSLLIPIQIIELHRFTHAALLREKKDEAEKAAQSL